MLPSHQQVLSGAPLPLPLHIGEDLCRSLCEIVGNGADLDVRRQQCGRDKGRWGAVVSVPRIGDAVDGQHIEG